MNEVKPETKSGVCIGYHSWRDEACRECGRRRYCMERTVRRVCGECQSGTATERVLQAIYRCEGRAITCVSTLGKVLDLRRETVSRAVGKLVEDGLLRHEPGIGRGDMSVMTITRQGFEQVKSHLLEKCDVTPQEQQEKEEDVTHESEM